MGAGGGPRLCQCRLEPRDEGPLAGGGGMDRPGARISIPQTPDAAPPPCRRFYAQPVAQSSLSLTSQSDATLTSGTTAQSAFAMDGTLPNVTFTSQTPAILAVNTTAVEFQADKDNCTFACT